MPHMAYDPTKEHYDVIVIGGGSAGLMAAGTAANLGKSVLIIEKNAELGKKLRITGGGRCNITNATFNAKEFLQNFGDAEKFLYSPFSRFDVQATFDFFESRGVPLVVEARNRTFPQSQKAEDVFRVMQEYINKRNVVSTTKNPVRSINVENGSIVSVTAKQGTYTADAYILASGGASHPETGSTGDGFGWLREIGHQAKAPTPNIVPLRTSDVWSHALSGTSLSFMKITFFVNDKKAFSKTGKILFTHFGLSAPLILNSAKQVGDLLQEGDVTAEIDCYPDTDLGSLEKQILKVFDDNKNKVFKNVTAEITPKGLSELSLLFDIIDPEEKVHSISKDARKEIAKLLKALPVNVVSLMGMDRAVVSDGGVPLSEVDMKTMKSKIINNLYFAGDILHINRPSGGYSLQLCWTTGYIAGHLE
jgi:predicted Rossmann fold flavoprotein